MHKKGSTETTVAELEQIIRDYVNRPRLHAELSADARNFDILCSALDVVGDAEAGIAAYTSITDPGSAGGRYIAIYGLLQMLCVEQDAVRAISRILSVQAIIPPEISDIRNIRHYSIGHPVPNRTSTPAGFISRAEMSLKAFKIMLCWPDKRPEIKQIDVSDIIARQRCALSNILHTVVEKLKDDEAHHRKAFRNQKLTDILHPSLSWLISKLGAVSQPEDKSARSVDLSFVREMVDAVRIALEDRGRAGAANHLLEDLTYPMTKLAAYYADVDGNQLEPEQADIYAFFISDRICKLSEIVKEIDEEFASNKLPG